VTNHCEHEGQARPIMSLDMSLPPDVDWGDIPALAELIAPKMAIMAWWLEAPYIPDLEPEAFFCVLSCCT
jgi:hypothetical protein